LQFELPATEVTEDNGDSHLSTKKKPAFTWKEVEVFFAGPSSMDGGRNRLVTRCEKLRSILLATANRSFAMTESDLKHHQITRTILRAFFQSHTDLGYGFLESVYVNALCVLLRQFGLEVERQVPTR
jgi:hypothetical protein